MKTHDLVWREIPKILQHGTLDISAHVAQVTQPTLILHGCEDIVLPISGARQLAQVLKTAKLVEIPGHGHSLNVEDPKLFVDLMLEAFSQEPLAH
jgi:pimeloyl-ACP methyl ester carboxylesterase